MEDGRGRLNQNAGETPGRMPARTPARSNKRSAREQPQPKRRYGGMMQSWEEVDSSDDSYNGGGMPSRQKSSRVSASRSRQSSGMIDAAGSFIDDGLDDVGGHETTNRAYPEENSVGEKLQQRKSANSLVSEDTIKKASDIIDTENRSNTYLQDRVKQLEKQLANFHGQRKLFESKIEEIGGVSYKVATGGTNAGKLITKNWKVIFDGGKNYKEWTIL